MQLTVYALVLPVALCAQEQLRSRMTPGAYEAHVRIDDAEVAADFLVHSIPAPQFPMLTNDYLVLEIGWFPTDHKRVVVNSARLTLRVNGKKDLLVSQAPAAVAVSIKYPDWRQHRELTAGASVGDADVVVGRLPQTSRFPEDNRVPRLPRRPAEAPMTRMCRRASPWTFLQSTALPEGETRHPVSVSCTSPTLAV